MFCGLDNGREKVNDVEYWIDLAQYDLETAKAMNSTHRYLYVGFMCHQVMEKAFKAFFCKQFKKMPPFTHNLSLLAEKSGLYGEMSEEQKNFLDFLEPLNIEARYPTQKAKLLALLGEGRCNDMISKTENELKWLMTKL